MFEELWAKRHLLLDSNNLLVALKLNSLIDTAIRAAADKASGLVMLCKLLLTLKQRHR